MSSSTRTPFYPRVLRLRHVRPNAWQRAALGEGALALAGVLVLADVATAWTLLALPVAVAAVVKAHDVVAGLLGAPATAWGRDDSGVPGDEPLPDGQLPGEGLPDEPLPDEGLPDEGLPDGPLPDEALSQEQESHAVPR